MKYLVLILTVLLIVSLGLGYWYYRDSQLTINTLSGSNVQLETGIKINEATIQELEQSYQSIQQELARLDEENRQIRRNNQMLVDRFSDSDISLLGAAKPELVETLINRGTENAFRCFELMSGAEMTSQEINARTAIAFNRECPWLWPGNQ